MQAGADELQGFVEADLNTAEAPTRLLRVVGSQIKPWAPWCRWCPPYSTDQLWVGRPTRPALAPGITAEKMYLKVAKGQAYDAENAGWI